METITYAPCVEAGKARRTVRQGCATCGNKNLYKAHDTSKPYRVSCSKCGHNGAWVMTEPDGSRHACEVHYAFMGGMAPATAPASVPVSAPEHVSAPVNGTASPDAEAERLRALDVLLSGARVSEEQVREIVDKAIAEAKPFPTTLRIIRPDSSAHDLTGIVHEVMPNVIRLVSAGLKPMLVGPAGTGKSFIAMQAAQALGLEFGEINCNPQMTATALLGYCDANGKYVRTAFRECFENGGLFHFDEIDNSHSSILATMNGALANGHMFFPDNARTPVKRHPDFRVIASANTFGNGADRVYVGRQKLDGATTDRFWMQLVDYDLTLEDALAAESGLDVAIREQVVSYVRALRRNQQEMQMPLIFGVRSSREACLGLAIGMSWSDCVEGRIRHGISDADWAKVSKGVTVPAL